jgi:hypothetical protein
MTPVLLQGAQIDGHRRKNPQQSVRIAEKKHPGMTRDVFISSSYYFITLRRT